MIVNPVKPTREPDYISKSKSRYWFEEGLWLCYYNSPHYVLPLPIWDEEKQTLGSFIPEITAAYLQWVVEKELLL